MISFIPLILFFYGAVQGAEYHIANADQLVAFSNSVNSGATYSGTTVLLDSDIDLAGKAFKTIGYVDHNFIGTFDGQGHVVRNLKVSTPPYNYAGFLGYSDGATVRNVVMDESCSIANVKTSTYACMGAVITYCRTNSRPCVIENNVNMANVSFKGSATDGFHIGGIVGVLWRTNYDITVNNCVNYGALINQGSTPKSFNMGGIIGHLRNQIKIIQNCFNYGIMSDSGSTVGSKIFGGVSGIVCSDNPNYEEANIVNCLSAGRVIMKTANNAYSGGILGCISGYINVTITHCFWTEGNATCESCKGLNTLVNTVDSTVSELNSTVMDELFEYEAESSGSGTEALKRYVLHLNGGKISGFSEDTVTALGKEFPVPVKEGNEFLFWCEDNKCIVKYDPNNKTSNATDMYAMWKINTVRFDSNGGDVLTVKEMTVTYEGVYAELPEPTREGYTFVGWFTEEDEEVTSEKKVEIPMDHTLYAKWVINEYNVTFVLANGTVVEYVLEFGTEVPYPDEAEMRRDGYTFAGWDVSDETVPADNLTITSKWTANNYTVRFDVNGGDGLTEDGMNVTYDDVYGDSLPEPTREGYTFAGWFTEEDEEITSETTVKILVDITVTAKWNPKEYTVRFDVNGGDGLTDNDVNVTFDSAYGDSLPIPTRTNYTFIGWFTEEGEKITSETVVAISGDHTLIAQWKEVEYNVTFVFANGTVIEKPFKFNEEIEYPEEGEMKRDGYTFDGWDTNEEFAPAGGLNITAKWTPNNYTVKFDANGGDALTEDETKVTYDSAYGDSLPEPTREGYSFAGWFTEEDNEITSETTVKIIVDITITAKWTPNNYTVKFDVNGGDALTEDETKVTYDGVYGDSLPTPSRDGYTFAGWFTEEDEEVTSETIVEISKDHTLHAEWKENPTSQVEIVFGSKDLSQDRIKDFVNRNTDAEFKIVRFEKDENKAEVRVIIQFNDPKDAEEFIGKLGTSDDSMIDLVKSSRYASEEFSGLSAMNYPTTLLLFSLFPLI